MKKAFFVVLHITGLTAFARWYYPETLLAGMKRDTRYEIRRAQREGFIYDFLNGGETDDRVGH